MPVRNARSASIRNTLCAKYIQVLKRITVAPRTETIFLLFSTINSTKQYVAVINKIDY